jgi:TRAP-type uncharacterized transport system substrate-binding protein
MSFSDKRLVFGGAGGGILGPPWGIIGRVTAKALEPLGYQLTINGDAWGTFNPRMVADGEVDFGATRASNALAAYRGKGAFSDKPRTNLRAIAAIQHPTWEAVAVRWETGLQSLADIKERRYPVRIIGGEAPAARLILEHYGLTREVIESFGGKFQGSAPRGMDRLPRTQFSWVRAGDYDLIIGTIFAGYGPEVWQLHEASILHNLRFLPLEEAAVHKLCEEEGGTPSMLPHHLLRGIDVDTPSVMRLPQIIYGRDDMPEDFAYTVAKAVDENAHLFREVYLAYSYDWRAATNTAIPLHPGALRYYQEKGYPILKSHV